MTYVELIQFFNSTEFFLEIQGDWAFFIINLWHIQRWCSTFCSIFTISPSATQYTYNIPICGVYRSHVAFESKRNAAKMISIKQFAQCLGRVCIYTCPSAHLRYEWLINLSEIPLLDCIILDAATALRAERPRALQEIHPHFEQKKCVFARN